MLGTDARIVQTRRDRMRFDGLPVVVLQQVRERTLECAGRATGEGRGVTTGFDAVARRLEADQSDTRIVDERVEDADRIGPAADTRSHRIGQPARLVLDLHARLETDHPLKVTDHRRERMRARRGAEAVIRVVGVGHPVSERLVDRVLERLGPGLHRHDFGSEQPHPRDVQRLPGGVDGAHVDHTVQAQQRTRRRGGHPVLTGAGLRDDARLAHLTGQQGLTQHVVDLVRSSVVQVFSLEEDPRTTRVLAEPGGFVERRRPTAVVPLQAIQLIEEFLVTARLFVRGGDLLDDGHQRFGDESSSVDTEMALGVGIVGGRLRDRRAGTRQLRAGEIGHQ